MKKKVNLTLIAIILIFVLLAWSPWLNINIAAAKIQNKLSRDFGNCKFYPQIVDWQYSIYPQRIPFGFINKIRINCNPNMNQIYDEEVIYYMNPFGIVLRLS